MTPDGWYLQEWRKARGFTLQLVAERLDTSLGFLSDIERGKRRLTSEMMARLAEVYGVMIADLLRHPSADRPRARMAPLVGYVSAGAQAVLYAEGQGPFDEVPAPEGSTESTVAVEIRGDSLGSLFNEWLVFYDDVRRPVTPDMVGKLCVVGLPDGRILVKKLARSKTEGLFHLLSATEDPILDAPVEWAALVRFMSPR